MKVAYFGSGAHSVDLKRHILFAEVRGYETVSSLSNCNNFSKLDPISLLISDSCDFKTLFNIFFWQMQGRFSKIDFIDLELFNLSFKAWREELNFMILNAKPLSNWKSILYFCFVMPIRIVLTRIVLNVGIGEVIVPSKLRIDFLKSVLPKHIAFTLLRNKPILSELNLDKPVDFEHLIEHAQAIIENGRFLFIGGRINVESDFYRICSYANQKKLKIIAATSQEEMLRRSISEFPDLILSLGRISNTLVMYISSKCLAGICIYHNFTSNQRLSASSKFFEFMLMNKPIIASDNLGMRGEIQPKIQHLVISIDNLSKDLTIQREEIKLNKEYDFEYELEKFQGQEEY